MAKNKAKAKSKWDGNDTTALARAFLSMRDSGEMKTFMRDLLTESEIVEFANRFRAARSLSKSIHYAAIEEDTGLSSRTIARVHKWLKSGKGGYTMMLKRLKMTETL